MAGFWHVIASECNERSNLTLPTTVAMLTKIREVRLLRVFQTLAMTLAILLSVLQYAPTHAATSTDSLVGYWKLDETSGTSAADASGDGNTGTLTNGPTISTDVPSTISFLNPRSLSFDGVNDYVSAGSASALDVAASAFSISVWVNISGQPATNKQQDIILKCNQDLSNNGYGFSYDNISGNHLNLYKCGVADQKISYALNSNTWYHIVAVQNFSGGAPSNVTFYVNGVSAGTVSNTSAFNSSSNKTAFIGGGSTYTNSTSVNGLIDDVRIYNRALSATEISALASGTHTSATWSGGTSTNYETASNWNTSAIPDPYTRVTIANSGAAPVCTANIQTAGLTINSSSALDLSSYNLTLNDSGTFTNNGTLY